ncbi:tetratricopeptide repeat protein [Stieleria varia]|uniref:Tetratricopeptide repeat protein n=1 Tax=Stieleria varia TaxID=2528005 RepID=A0A5C6AYU0_9BACT|nr:tetratricopeptide repeat protein [Stieleria varia]TWU04850.1 Tetratricopeptide repeat protein [Stieleria varia]
MRLFQRFINLTPVLAVFALGIAHLLPGRLIAAEPPDANPVASIASARQLLQTGEVEAAAEMLIQLDDACVADPQSTDTDPSLELALAARALEAAGKIEAAVVLHQRALAALDRPAAQNVAPQSISVIRIAAGNAALKTGQWTTAANAFAQILEMGDSAPQQFRTLARKSCSKTGWAALSNGQASIAESAYRALIEYSTDAEIQTDRAACELGLAWSVAMQTDRCEDAAELLDAFTSNHPDHADVAQAVAMRAHCLRMAGKLDLASEVSSDLLRRWPESASVSELLAQVAAGVFSATDSDQRVTAIQGVAEPIRNWFRQSTDKQQQQLAPATLALGMWLMGEQSDSSGQDFAADQTLIETLGAELASRERSGQVVSDLLSLYRDSDRMAEAEQYATMVLASGASDQPASANATEAVCRWLGRNERWMILALAAEDLSPETGQDSRTVAVERLFAEALMQSGRRKIATAWWTHLVDQRDANDFATLLRCAETTSSFGTSAEAQARIDAARQAAQEDESRVVLVDMLDAELAIRRVDFDAARGHFERVVRSGQSTSDLRGRAQWMIGESFLLQHRFADAISAYRLVEGIDPDGQWIAPALVQAGQAFEQLGRTREAAICYGDLIGRFPTSRHAAMGRQRLASIAPDENASNRSLR